MSNELEYYLKITGSKRRVSHQNRTREFLMAFRKFAGDNLFEALNVTPINHYEAYFMLMGSKIKLRSPYNGNYHLYLYGQLFKSVSSQNEFELLLEDLLAHPEKIAVKPMG